MLLDYLYDGALRFYCKAAGLDPTVVLAWVRGEGVIPWALAKLIERDLGLAAEAWPRISGRPPGKPRMLAPGLVAYKHAVLQRRSEQPMTPEEVARRQQWGVKWGRPRRRQQTKVHEILDDMGWTVADLHKRLKAHLAAHDKKKRTMSRASIQWYCAGERTFASPLKKGRCPATAPLWIRRAAEVVTEGKLKLHDWPNTEDEDA